MNEHLQKMVELNQSLN
jgi:protein subunit release factor A